MKKKLTVDEILKKVQFGISNRNAHIPFYNVSQYEGMKQYFFIAPFGGPVFDNLAQEISKVFKFLSQTS